MTTVEVLQGMRDILVTRGRYRGGFGPGESPRLAGPVCLGGAYYALKNGGDASPNYDDLWGTDNPAWTAIAEAAGVEDTQYFRWNDATEDDQVVLDVIDKSIEAEKAKEAVK